MKNIVVEQENIAKAVVCLVNKYKNLPCRCEYQSLGNKPYNLSLSSLTGAPKVDEDVTGAYESEFPFMLYLRTKPEDTADRLDCEQFLNELAQFLEKNYAKIKIKDRQITELEQTATASLFARTDDGAVDYQVILRLKYETI